MTKLPKAHFVDILEIFRLDMCKVASDTVTRTHENLWTVVAMLSTAETNEKLSQQ